MDHPVPPVLSAAASRERPVLFTMLCRFSTKPDTGTVTDEVFVDQVELGTPVCATAEKLVESLGA